MPSDNFVAAATPIGFLMFDVVFVLYNRCISTIASLQSLCDSSAIQSIVVCDNSTDGTILQRNESSATPKVKYLNMHGNTGLSHAYNAALQFLTSEYVLILDDDTSIPTGYIDTVSGYIQRYNNADILLPIVKSAKIIMSPCKKNGLRFSQLLDITNLPPQISAINSGMVVKRSLYQHIKYRESLFLDMVDHAFMDDAREYGARVVIMPDAVILQDYSRETDDFDAATRRFQITKRDNRVYYSKIKFGKAYCEAQLLYWKIKSCFRYRTFRALAW
jgi:GT2 family glycosyltransferase